MGQSGKMTSPSRGGPKPKPKSSASRSSHLTLSHSGAWAGAQLTRDPDASLPQIRLPQPTESEQTTLQDAPLSLSLAEINQDLRGSHRRTRHCVHWTAWAGLPGSAAECPVPWARLQLCEMQGLYQMAFKALPALTRIQQESSTVS